MAERASQETVVAAPAERIMDIITDFEAYPDWAEAVRDIEIRATDEDGRPERVWFHLDAKVMEIEYVLEYEYADDALRWHLVEGDQFRKLDGEYLLIPDGDHTRVRYTLEADLAMSLPGFLKKRAAKQILETGLGELKRRAESGV